MTDQPPHVLYVITVSPELMREREYYAQDCETFANAAGMPCRMVHYSELTSTLAETQPAAIVHSGGPASSTFPDEPVFHDVAYREAALGAGVPQLAICRAFQVFSSWFGAKLAPMPAPADPATSHLQPDGDFWWEKGLTPIELLDQANALFGGLPRNCEFQQKHRNEVTNRPACLELLATNNGCANQAWRHREIPHLYGVQFHPERPSPQSDALLANFFRTVSEVCPS